MSLSLMMSRIRSKIREAVSMPTSQERKEQKLRELSKRVLARYEDELDIEFHAAIGDEAVAWAICTLEEEEGDEAVGGDLSHDLAKEDAGYQVVGDRPLQGNVVRSRGNL